MAFEAQTGMFWNSNTMTLSSNCGGLKLKIACLSPNQAVLRLKLWCLVLKLGQFWAWKNVFQLPNHSNSGQKSPILRYRICWFVSLITLSLSPKHHGLSSKHPQFESQTLLVWVLNTMVWVPNSPSLSSKHLSLSSKHAGMSLKHAYMILKHASLSSKHYGLSLKTPQLGSQTL